MPTRIATSLPYTELEVADGNFDTSRSTIDRVVIHTMVGTWQGAAARFDNPTQQVSAHYGVKLDGGLIHWLEEYYTGYHAGNYAMNQRSIGIEHEDGGDFNGVRPAVLYESSAKLVADICTFYAIPIDRNHIIKHSEVIATGCPDSLDIDRIVNRARDIATPKPTIPQPNPGYAATRAGATVQQGNLTYRSYEKDGQFLWTVEPSAPEVVTPPVEIPIPVTTTSSPVVPPSTQGTSSATPTTTVATPPVVVQPLPMPTPTKPPLTTGDAIVYKKMGIINALKRFWQFLFGK